MGCPPAPVYKGVEEGAGQGGWRALRGSPTPTGSRTPLFPIRSRRGKEEEGGRKERGAGPPPNSDWAWGGAPSLAPFPSFPLSPLRPIHLPGVPITSRSSGIVPISPGTFLVSKYSHPIYRYLRLDYFETPRHVPDLIGTPNYLRYIKTHNS